MTKIRSEAVAKRDLEALMQLVEDYAAATVRHFLAGKDSHSAASTIRKRRKQELETVLEGLIK